MGAVGESDWVENGLELGWDTWQEVCGQRGRREPQKASMLWGVGGEARDIKESQPQECHAVGGPRHRTDDGACA